jgi:predicted RNA-binding Zn-ribbon protein involved in translation (DUF1610 family)
MAEDTFVDWPEHTGHVTLPCPSCGRDIDYRLAMRRSPEGSVSHLQHPPACPDCQADLPSLPHAHFEGLDEALDEEQP